LLRGTLIAGPRKDIGVVFQSPSLPVAHRARQRAAAVDVQRLGRAGTNRWRGSPHLVGLKGFEGK